MLTIDQILYEPIEITSNLPQWKIDCRKCVEAIEATIPGTDRIAMPKGALKLEELLDIFHTQKNNFIKVYRVNNRSLTHTLTFFGHVNFNSGIPSRSLVEFQEGTLRITESNLVPGPPNSLPIFLFVNKQLMIDYTK